MVFKVPSTIARMEDNVGESYGNLIILRDQSTGNTYDCSSSKDGLEKLLLGWKNFAQD